MLIKEFRENPIYIFLLLFLFVGYTGLHIEYPDKDAVFSHLNLNWQQLKEEFYDENGDMYFLAFDSYYYLNEAKQDKELDSGGFLSWLVRLDYRINEGRILFTPYISFFFGALVLFLVFYITFLYSKSFYMSWLAAAFLMFDKYFFSITMFYFLDTNVLNVFFTLIIFLCIYKMMMEQGFFRLLFWGITFISFFVLYIMTWSGWLIILIPLFLFFSLSNVYSLHFFSKRKCAFFFGILSLIVGLIIYFSNIVSNIKDYFLIDFSRVAELGRFDFDFFYIIIVVICIYYSITFLYQFIIDQLIEFRIFKETNNESIYLLLLSFIIPFMIFGVLSKRFIIFFLPFAYILIFIEIEKLWEKKMKNLFWTIPKRMVVFLFFIILIIVYSNNIGSYNGLLYGFSVVEDAIVETGKWFNENSEKDEMILTFWDYGIFYEYFANRTAKYKSSPMLMSNFSYGLLQENLTTYSTDFFGNGIIVIDTHMKRQIPNIERFANMPYTNKTLLYHFLQGETFGNYTLIYEKVGIRDTYYIYNFS